MKPSVIFISVLAVLLLVAGYFWFVMRENTPSQNTSAETSTNTSTDTVQNEVPSADPGEAEFPTKEDVVSSTVVEVAYTDAGFSPASVTVRNGQSVAFVNKGSKNMWVATDAHPLHTGYAGTTRADHCPDTAGTSFDQCTAGASYTFSFTKAGAWPYHNHVSAGHTGTVVVTE